jgi:hypothetical protein
LNQIRKRLTYANVMSSIAVFLLLGGATAFAAGHLGKNTVGTKQLKKNAVTTAKIKKNAVNAAKIKAGSVDGSKLGAGAVTGEKLANDAVTTEKIANDAVTGDKVKESSLSEVPSANKANNATTAGSATFAESANPEVFAKVNTDGTVDGANSKGLTDADVTNPGAGVYCITVPSFTPRGAQATTQFGGSGGTTAQVTIGGTGNCPFPEVQVLTWSGGSTPTAGNLTFYVMLYH